ncbi:hypothetical protein QGN32_01230 [Mycolicibacterium sp. ND9-15]|uniref:DUF7715 family protein n=1 Tax=Mycolicibacterium sp. ND9-15 TaxID=3042320 RepID=UPI002DD818BB|nr:hypothetical protein [Mycolicibacterium sp. ND9-15]WSE56591.1 hypothetical protein QGN32_01230 [Mycolicibacterium sp. ND9-15]
MKILVATALTQGTHPGDYNHCVEGELVWVQEPCDRDIRDSRMPCGCGRGFAGAASHRATTTARVVESPLTREELVTAFQTSLQDGGWPAEWAEDVVEDNIFAASQFPVGTVVGRNLELLISRPQHAR